MWTHSSVPKTSAQRELKFNLNDSLQRPKGVLDEVIQNRHADNHPPVSIADVINYTLWPALQNHSEAIDDNTLNSSGYHS